MTDYTKINAETVDRWVDEGWIWGKPVSEQVCADVRKGEWHVLLTPTVHVPKEWFGDLKNKKVLGLASGGGQQMPVFSLIGACCTIMDLSDRQLESERMVAEREKYDIEIVKADMTKAFPFEDEQFDLIFHPVSNCYVEDVHHVWRECYRVLRTGGVLLSGMDNGLNYLFDDIDPGSKLTVTGSLPFNPLKNPEQMKMIQEDDGGVQFSHTFNEQIGGQLKAGFVISGAYEDYDIWTDGENRTVFATAEAGLPTYWATKAVKTVHPA